MQMLQQVSGHNVGLVVGYTPNRLDVRTRQEQRVGTWSQDDMVNTGINMLREAIGGDCGDCVPTFRRVVAHQLYGVQVWEK